MATFHPFPRLPAELRYAMWELTLEPREVVIKTHYQPESPGGENPNIITSFYSPATIPSALHTCQDSRDLFASRHYTRAFTNGTTPHYVWANFALDTIGICDINLLDLIVLPDPPAIRYLTIDCPAHSLLEGWDPAFTACTERLRNLSTLERASVVCAQRCQVPCHRATYSTHVSCADKWNYFLNDLLLRGSQDLENASEAAMDQHVTFAFPDETERRNPRLQPLPSPCPAWTMRFADTPDMTPEELQRQINLLVFLVEEALLMRVTCRYPPIRGPFT